MTDTTLYRLADHTAAEPLVNRWVAWPHVFSPLPYSLHLARYQCPTLESYLKNPRMHADAGRNPKLYGGPFVDIPVARAAEAEALLEASRQEHREDLELAEAFIDFHNRLVAEAKGHSLESYYAELPEPLRGCVELVYDYYNRPTVRCLESLLYAGPHYKPQMQSLYLFAQEQDSERPYYMSTPRLPEPGRIDWAVPFASGRVSELFRLDSESRPLGRIRELLGLTPADDPDLLPLLTTAPPRGASPWNGPGARIRYLGHACVLVEWNGASVLIDPFIPVAPRDGGVDRYTFGDLPPQIDYVLITHGHHDHFVFESLLRIRHKVGCLVVPRGSGLFHGDVSLKLMARQLGFQNVEEVDSLDSLPLPDGEIVAIPFFGEHSDLPHAKSGYVVRAGRESVLFAADSNCLDPGIYRHVRRLLGPIGTVFLGMECIGAPLSWVYGPLLPMPPEHSHSTSRRSNGSNAPAAMALLKAVEAQRVCVYAIGREPWLRYFLALTPADDDPYILESNRVLDWARNRGFRDAQRPYGRMEMHLAA